MSHRLISTRKTDMTDPRGRPLASYRLALEHGGVLAVVTPAAATPLQALEIADQLRELTYALATNVMPPEGGPGVRAGLLQSASDLACAHAGVTDLAAAQSLLARYDTFRRGVVEYLLTSAGHTAHEPKSASAGVRLVGTRYSVTNEATGNEVARYHTVLTGGVPLSVAVPARLTPRQALEIADHLVELIDLVVRGANVPAYEPADTEALLRSSEQIRLAHAGAVDFESAQDLLGYYSTYREVVVDLLRAAGRRP